MTTNPDDIVALMRAEMYDEIDNGDPAVVAELNRLLAKEES